MEKGRDSLMYSNLPKIYSNLPNNSHYHVNYFKETMKIQVIQCPT
jgi:hypothetical protein